MGRNFRNFMRRTDDVSGTETKGLRPRDVADYPRFTIRETNTGYCVVVENNENTRRCVSFGSLGVAEDIARGWFDKYQFYNWTESSFEEVQDATIIYDSWGE